MEHFESVADVNEWDEASKKKWLRVRLTGRAATAYKRLTAEVKGDYDATIKALTDRFETESRKELFLAEFQCRRKKKTEDWATFADNLLILAEKAYPSLQPEAQELLALNHYLDHLNNPHVAFGVRQKRTASMDVAVAVTLELESYLPENRGRVQRTGASVGVQEPDEPGAIAATSIRGGRSDDDSWLAKLMQRLDRIEAQITTAKDQPRYRDRGEGQRPGRRRGNRSTACFRCHQEGHMMKDCTAKSENSQQGNDKPSEQ